MKLRDFRRLPIWFKIGAPIAAAYELSINLPEAHARAATFAEARAYALRVGKPLLNVGCPGPWKGSYSDGAADVCLDIDTDKLRWCYSAQPTPGNILALPFEASTFGAATCFHVLEHMRSLDDAERAVAELERVADRVFILIPGHSFWATFHSDHFLWLDRVEGGYLATDRKTGEQRVLLLRDSQPAQIGQALPASWSQST